MDIADINNVTVSEEAKERITKSIRNGESHFVALGGASKSKKYFLRLSRAVAASFPEPAATAALRYYPQAEEIHVTFMASKTLMSMEGATVVPVLHERMLMLPAQSFLEQHKIHVDPLVHYSVEYRNGKLIILLAKPLLQQTIVAREHAASITKGVQSAKKRKREELSRRRDEKGSLIGQPHITVNANRGVGILSPEAIEAYNLDRFKFVTPRYDADNKRMLLDFTVAEEHGSHRMQGSRKSVSLLRILKRNKLPYQSPGFYALYTVQQHPVLQLGFDIPASGTKPATVQMPAEATMPVQTQQPIQTEFSPEFLRQYRILQLMTSGRVVDSGAWLGGQPQTLPSEAVHPQPPAPQPAATNMSERQVVEGFALWLRAQAHGVLGGDTVLDKLLTKEEIDRYLRHIGCGD